MIHPWRRTAGRAALGVVAALAVFASGRSFEIVRLLDRPERLVVVTSCTGYVATFGVTKHGRHEPSCLRAAARDMMRRGMSVTVEHGEIVVGRVAAAWTDGNGLLVRILFARTRAGRDAGLAVRRGELTGLSPLFVSLEHHVGRDPRTGASVRVFRRVDPRGVSIVSSPVDPCARITRVGEDAE